MSFAKADNVFNNSQKAISNKFIFSHVDNKSIKIKQRMLYNVVNILFLHLIFKEMIFNIILEIDLNDNNILQILNDKIKEKYMKSEILITENIYEELIKISIKICSLKKYDYESILFFIKQAEKNFIKIKNENFSEIITNNFKIIEKLLKEESKTLAINSEEENNGINSAVKNLLINQTNEDDYKKKLKDLANLSKEANSASILDMEQGIIV